MHIHSHPSAESSDQSHGISRVLTNLVIGGAIAGAAVMLAPHILPAMGIGSAALAEESMWVLHTGAEAGGTGLAGAITTALGAVPVIGGHLAAGGLFNAAATGAIGIGGVLLGNHIEKKEDSGKGFKWGKVIKYATLVTSALIALPTILTAIGSGLIYLSTLAGSAGFSSSVVSLVSNTLGTMGRTGHAMMGFSGIAAVIPHLLTCGVSVLPAALAYTLPADEAHPAQASSYTDGSIGMQVETAPLEAGKPCKATLRLTNRHTGQPLSVDELAVVHTEKLHLFVIDSSMRDYHHIHPMPTPEPGVFEFSFTPTLPTHYHAWADCTMLKDNKNHRLKTEMAAAGSRNLPPHIRITRQAEHNGLQVEWLGDPLRKDTDTVADIRITDAKGNPINDLEPVMGAFAHLVGFSADGASIIHTHPLGKEPASVDDRGEGRLRFHIEPDMAGDTQFYLQIRRGGEDSYIPFGQRIKAPELAAERLAVQEHRAYKHAV